MSILAAGSSFFVLGIVAARRYERDAAGAAGRIRVALVRVREGLGVFRRLEPAMRAAGLQTVAWALQLAAVWVAMRAFQLSLPLIAAGAVLALLNVALIVPLWPGNVGLQQTAVALPLVAYGVVYARGFAYGIGLQAIESSVGYAVGVLFLLREGLTIGRLRAVAAKSSDARAPER